MNRSYEHESILIFLFDKLTQSDVLRPVQHSAEYLSFIVGKSALGLVNRGTPVQFNYYKFIYILYFARYYVNIVLAVETGYELVNNY